MMGHREKLISGWEIDVISRYSRSNKPGVNKYVKHKVNKRVRKECKLSLKSDEE